MNKDEILEKSRRENKNKDIAEIEVINRASSIATSVGMLVCCLISVLDVLFTDKVNCITWTIYFSMLGTRFLVKYIKLRKKHELFFSLIYLIISIAFFVMYIMDNLAAV